MSNQSMYAMYVIGKVESGNSWTAVNYNDPITLGMMQWYGTRAYGLLDKGRSEDPTGWAQFKQDAPTLAGQVETNTISWTGRYLTRAEGNAFITWANRFAPMFEVTTARRTCHRPDGIRWAMTPAGVRPKSTPM